MMAEILTIVLVWGFAALASATPLIFVTLGETLTQRTGVIDLGVEGRCWSAPASARAGRCRAAARGADFWPGSRRRAAVAGARAGRARRAGEPIASGIAVWMLGLGVTSYAGRAFVGGEVTPLPRLAAADLREIPVIGPGLAQIGLSSLLAVAAVSVAAWWMARTRTGLGWRATGEVRGDRAREWPRPGARQVLAIVTGGALAGFGGALLSIDYTQTWAQEITKGQGLIAVGLVIVARWQPGLVLPVCWSSAWPKRRRFACQLRGSKCRPTCWPRCPISLFSR